MKLQPINASNLPLLEAGQFINIQLTEIRALGEPEIFTDEGMNDYLTELDTQLADFNNAINVVRKNKDTIKIEELDNRRDEALSFLHKSAAVYEISDEEEERDAARNLRTLFSSYKNLSTLSYGAESLGIDNLLNDLGSSEYESMVDVLDIEYGVDRLRAANEAFKELFSNRNQGAAQKETFDAQVLKKQMLAVYKDFADDVLAMAKRKNSPALYTNVLNAMNINRKYYADLLARRKGVAAEAV